jgi:hypothetical protein
MVSCNGVEKSWWVAFGVVNGVLRWNPLAVNYAFESNSSRDIVTAVSDLLYVTTDVALHATHAAPPQILTSNFPPKVSLSVLNKQFYINETLATLI